MKVLWIINILLPEAASILYGQSVFKTSGGWMVGAADALTTRRTIELSVASVSYSVQDLKIIKGEKVRHYIIPLGKGNTHKNNEYQQYFKKIYDDFKPDIVHIHGTEFSHGLAYVDACGARNVVVSIQGMTSAISYYFNYGVSTYDIIRNITIRDLIKGTLFKEKSFFRKRGLYEIELLQKVSHIIGRTEWDHAHTWAINPNAKYHFCNETLRPEFYDGVWEYEKCIPHTIFLSQAGKPVKGLHQLLKALPLIIKHYPDTQVKIAGQYYRNSGSLAWKIKKSGYEKYINTLITKNNLHGHISYLGALDAEGMKREYLSSNVFVCPSTIENSPNSLGEAQLLGMPCIASYVGGTMDMIPNMHCGDLYRFEEIEMLAWKICNVFEVSSTFDCRKMREEAIRRHDKEVNADRLLDIYRNILNREN